jgi:hypothetical protein
MEVSSLSGTWYEFRLQFASRAANLTVPACSEQGPYARNGVRAGAIAAVAGELRF